METCTNSHWCTDMWCTSFRRRDTSHGPIWHLGSPAGECTDEICEQKTADNESFQNWMGICTFIAKCLFCVAHRSVLLKVNRGIEIKIQPVISSTLIFKNFNTRNEKYGNDYYAIGMSQVYSNMQSEKGNLNCKCKFWFSHLLTFILSFSPCNIFMLYIT